MNSGSRILSALLPVLIFLAVHQEMSAQDTANTSEVVSLVVLGNGQVFEGKLAGRSKGASFYNTPMGLRRVSSDEVAAVRSDSGLRGRHRNMALKMARRNVEGHIGLALWCEKTGLLTGMVEELEIVFALSPLNASAWEILTRNSPWYRVAPKNPHPREKQGRWQRAQVDLLWRACRKSDAVKAAVVACQLDALPFDLVVASAVRHLEKGTRPQRWVAARVLRRARDPRRVKPLLRNILMSNHREIRMQAAASLAQHDDGTIRRPLVRALLTAPQSAVRVRAAEALEVLGDRRAVGSLVLALRRANGGRVAPRNNIVVLTQIAYVKDYDVEVAQSAVIADPIIDILQEGVVLDVAVIAITAQRQAYSRALRSLSGVNLGVDVGAWTEWYGKNRAAYKE